MEIWVPYTCPVGGEEWKVSNWGRLQRKYTRGWRPMNGTVLGDYLIFSQSRKRVHRFLAEKFLANPKGKPYIDHKDRNKLNNHVKNLRWCTDAENHQNQLAPKGYYKKGNKFEAKVNVNKEYKYLRRWATEREARKAYLEGKLRYHPFFFVTPNVAMECKILGIAGFS